MFKLRSPLIPNNIRNVDIAIYCHNTGRTYVEAAEKWDLSANRIREINIAMVQHVLKCDEAYHSSYQTSKEHQCSYKAELLKQYKAWLIDNGYK